MADDTAERTLWCFAPEDVYANPRWEFAAVLDFETWGLGVRSRRMSWSIHNSTFYPAQTMSYLRDVAVFLGPIKVYILRCESR